jgi:hypothetical protein
LNCSSLQDAIMRAKGAIPLLLIKHAPMVSFMRIKQ